MKDEGEIGTFEKSEKQLQVFLREVRELSNKHPNESLNKFKVELINMVLKTCNDILGPDKPFPTFELFDIDKIPSNSDARLILAHYASSMHAFRCKNTGRDQNFKWRWILKGKLSPVEASDPDHFCPPL